MRNDAGFVIMFWEFKDDGQSRMIFKPDFSNAKYSTFPMDGEYNALEMKTNKWVQNCEEANNTVKHFDCIQNYSYNTVLYSPYSTVLFANIHSTK